MSADEGTPADRPDEPVGHVFDQTNGVLGTDGDDETDERRDGTTRSPSSFGIPPIVSL